MFQLNQNHIIDTKDIDSSRKALYKFGGVAAIIAIMGTLLDITITFLPGWGVSTVPKTAIGWFIQFQNNWLLGLRNLDLLNSIISIVMIPMFCALYAVHQGVKKDYATLARGEHGSSGAFIGFVLSTIASISMSLVMLRGKIFSKATAYIGILGFILLLIYTVFATFVSKSNNIVMILAMPGGLLAFAWNIMIARKLLKLGQKESFVKERGSL